MLAFAHFLPDEHEIESAAIYLAPSVSIIISATWFRIQNAWEHWLVDRRVASERHKSILHLKEIEGDPAPRPADIQATRERLLKLTIILVELRTGRIEGMFRDPMPEA